jgi:hypothetical protein
LGTCDTHAATGLAVGAEPLAVARLELSRSPENTASQRVAERSGFRRGGVLRSYHVVARREDAAVAKGFRADDEPRARSMRFRRRWPLFLEPSHVVPRSHGWRLRDRRLIDRRIHE